MLITGGSDGRVIRFALATFAPSSPPLPGARVAAVSVPPAAVQRLPAHDSSVTGLQLDSRFLVTGGNDGRVRLFELREASAASSSSSGGPQTSGPYASNAPTVGVGAGEEGRQFQYEYIREMCEPSESVWKVAYTKETCVVMYKRAGRTFVEIWCFRVKDEELA